MSAGSQRGEYIVESFRLSMSEQQVITFDEEGNVYAIEKDWEVDKFSDFSYRMLLNEWAQEQYEYSIGSNGICTENFFVDVPWQINRDTYESKNLYWWGEDLIKKVNKHREHELIAGACPFVYTKEIYTRPEVESYYQAVFLPKTDAVTNSDFPVETLLSLEYEKRQRLQDTIYDLDWTNPLFICAPYDAEYYSDVFPEDRLFSLGSKRADVEWNARLLDLIQWCDTLYFQMISTPAVYSSYVGKNVKFYNTDILHTEMSDSELYTLDKSKKPEIYFQYLSYIHEVFENRGVDMDFWIRKFLSLDRIQTPDELSDSLQKTVADRMTQRLAKRSVRDIIGMTRSISLYPQLRSYSAQFNRAPSDSAVYYFNHL